MELHVFMFKSIRAVKLTGLSEKNKRWDKFKDGLVIFFASGQIYDERPCMSIYSGQRAVVAFVWTVKCNIAPKWQNFGQYLICGSW